jgi:hypothetical protein
MDYIASEPRQTVIRVVLDCLNEPNFRCLSSAREKAPLPRGRRRTFFVMVVALAIAIEPAAAQSSERPRLETNEAYVEEVTRTTMLAVTDPMAVFAFVLNSLPDRVKVYPTENYYYFTFIDNGVRYAGNIRIEPQDSGGQTVHFTYYQEASEWQEQTPLIHIVLDAARGVAVQKLERLVYRISYQAKSVVFALNDLSAVRPPATAIGSNEKFIGPIFDESGIRFFLVYNSKLKIFHYLLDETVSVADAFFSPPRTDRILIGKRTGFAFYRDHQLDRKILIGVHESNMRLNTYLDGPFDQLPDNFIEGETLRQAILEVQPGLRGHIDRFGSEPSGEVRFLIVPYLPYGKVDDLYGFHQCAAGKIRAPAYYDCFVYDRLGSSSGPRRKIVRKKPIKKSSLPE